MNNMQTQFMERQAEVMSHVDRLESSPKDKLIVESGSDPGYSHVVAAACSVAAPYHSVAILGNFRFKFWRNQKRPCFLVPKEEVSALQLRTDWTPCMMSMILD